MFKIMTYPILTDSRGVTSVLSAYRYKIPLLQRKRRIVLKSVAYLTGQVYMLSKNMVIVRAHSQQYNWMASDHQLGFF